MSREVASRQPRQGHWLPVQGPFVWTVLSVLVLVLISAAEKQQHLQQTGCSECLAIPLVAIVGRKRLEGYLVGGVRKSGPHLSGDVAGQVRHMDQKQERHQQQEGKHQYQRPQLRPDSGEVLGEPRADEKCPMTGPMTVCDSIGSYPAELIVHKLTSVRDAFAGSSSDFNLDSLLTDESQHSSEPFEEPNRKKHTWPSSDRKSVRHIDFHRPEAKPAAPGLRSRAADFVDLVERHAIRRLGPNYLSRPRRQVSSSEQQDSRSASFAGSSSPSTGPFESAQDRSSSTASEPICRVRSIYISPRAALNDKKQWRYVVNAPEGWPQIKQIIRVDICQQPFEPCSSQVSLPLGFSSQCKQKYSKKKLLALDSQSGRLEVDTFFVPSCCVCQLLRPPLESDPSTSSFDSASNADSRQSDQTTATSFSSSVEDS